MSDRDGNEEIYVISADGSGPRNLTNHAARDRWPTWAPDGNRLVFESDRDGNVEIYVVNADGSGLRNLTNNTADDVLPSWAPDGNRLAFVSNRDGGHQIYVMNADGSRVARLTEFPGRDYGPYGGRWGGTLSWSPDGTRIAFDAGSADDLGASDVYVVNADGSGLRSLSSIPRPNRSPSWSPDGTRLAFVHLPRDTSRAEDSEDEGGASGDADVMAVVYVVNADGTFPRRLTSGFNVGGPDWSPDGTRLAFDCGEDICIISADGSHERSPAATRTGPPECPAWSPDGTRITYQVGQFYPRIWVENVDGSGARALGEGRCPAWSPDGTVLAFERSDTAFGIYVVGVTDRSPTRLTDHGHDPTWRPVSQPRPAPPVATGITSFGPRFALFERQLAPRLAALDSVRSRLRRDSGTARADSAFEAFRRSYAPPVPDWGAGFERWLQSEPAAFDSAERFFSARWLVLGRSFGEEEDAPVEYRLAPDLDSLARGLGAYLTRPMRAYHQTVAREVAGSVAYEGALLHDWDELEQNIVIWEAFLEAYPGFAAWDSLWSDAQRRYASFLRDYVQGFEIMRPVESGELSREARASYERLVARHGNTHAGGFVRGLLDAYRRDGYRNGNAVQMYLATTPLPGPGQRPGQ